MQGKDTGPKFPTAKFQVGDRTLTAVFNAGTIEAIEEACGRSCFDLFDELVISAASEGKAIVRIASLRTARRVVAGAFGLSLNADMEDFVDDVVPMEELLEAYKVLLKPFTQAVIRIMKPVKPGEEDKKDAAAEKASAEENPPSSVDSASGLVSSA